MIALINGTPAGASIYMAIHSITANIVYNAIVAAVQQRGVHVYVVHNGVDKNSTDSTPTDLHNLLGANHHWCDHGSSTLAYGGGCLSNDPSGIMHAKYMLFSQTKDSAGTLKSYVTWFGSPNMTWNSGTDLFNNAITVYGDQTLYTNFYNYEWTPQWQESYAGTNFYDSSIPRGYFGSSTSNVQVYASPESETDLVANRLGYIDADANCRIRVMENMIHDNRSAVVDKLLSLHSGGCKIWVAVDNIESTSLSRLKGAGISVHQAPVHDKSIVVYSKYAGSTAYRYLIFTGSHNLTYSALHLNDELLVKVEDPSGTLYNAYYNHFNDAYNTGTAL
jgi:phosphatidylserine/phosphatidylglycerophosphate/cardiolipin synthase-like enzyme